MATFQFQPKWKEELVCTGPGGAFVLDLTMGVLTAYLPTEEVWKRQAPDWARGLWPVLRDDLKAWCAANKINFVIDPTAIVY